MSTRPSNVYRPITERVTPGSGSHPLMLPPSSRKASTLFTPLLTTSTSFVATRPTWPTKPNRLSRIVVAEDGSATAQMETVGVTHSRPGKRYYRTVSRLVEMLTTTTGLLVQPLRQHYRLSTSSRARRSTTPLDRTVLPKQHRSDRLASCRCFC